MASTDQNVATGFAAALKYDPDPTGISQSLLSIGAKIASIFTGAHTAAVAKEAQTINQAMPAFLNGVQQIMSALNAGTISEAQAVAGLEGLQTAYYAKVAAIIKKSGACDTGCVSNGAPIYTSGFPGGAGVSTSPNDCNSGRTCNAACAIGCYCVEPTVAGLTRIIQAGGGSFQIPSTHGGDNSIGITPSFVVSYQRPNLLTSIDRTILGDLGLSSGATGTSGSGNVLLLLLAGMALLFVIVIGRMR